MTKSTDIIVSNPGSKEIELTITLDNDWYENVADGEFIDFPLEFSHLGDAPVSPSLSSPLSMFPLINESIIQHYFLTKAMTTSGIIGTTEKVPWTGSIQ